MRNTRPLSPPCDGVGGCVERQPPSRNREILDRVIKYASGQLFQDFWDKTLGEVRNGRITPPVPITEALLNSTPLTPRCAIKDEHGGRAKKVRVVGDFRVSGINGVMSTLDTSIPQTLGVFLARAPLF